MILGNTSPPRPLIFQSSNKIGLIDKLIDAVVSNVTTEPQRSVSPPQSVFSTPVSVMAPADDHRRDDTVPPLTLRQKLQITPFIMVLREYRHMPACFRSHLRPDVLNCASIL